jgi:uncharacterized membrane-anchored protein
MFDADKYKNTMNDLKEKTIIQQRVKLETYRALRELGLPIPPDLKKEVEDIDA